VWIPNPWGKETEEMEMSKSRLKILPLFLAIVVVCVASAVYAGEQAYLGVVLQPLTVDLKEAMDVKRDLQGVLISDVVDQSPADEYGLRDGDILIEIAGEEIDTVKGAVSAIKSHAPGDEVKIVVLRDGDKKEAVTVVLGKRGEDDEKMLERFHFQSLPDISRHFEGFHGEPQGYLGVRIENISTSDLGDYFGVEKGEGVLVVEVVEDSPADEAGILAGDVILKVDGKDVKSTDKLVQYIRKSEPGDKTDLTIKRKRRTKTIEVDLGKTDGHAGFFMKGLDAPGKCQMDKIKLPDIEKIRKRVKVGRDDDDGHIRVYTYGGDDMEDIEVLGLDSDDLKGDMEDLEAEMEQLKAELKELKTEIEKLSGR
jgi:membrane-associated protease RseP (regulator of RpoE activity)